MNNREERDALVKILADLIEQQKTLQSKTLGKVIHHLKIWLNRLYREATKLSTPIDKPEGQQVYDVSSEGGDRPSDSNPIHGASP